MDNGPEDASQWGIGVQNEFEKKLEENRQKLELLKLDVEEKSQLLLKVNIEIEELNRHYFGAKRDSKT